MGKHLACKTGATPKHGHLRGFALFSQGIPKSQLNKEGLGSSCCLLLRVHQVLSHALFWFFQWPSGYVFSWRNEEVDCIGDQVSICCLTHWWIGLTFRKQLDLSNKSSRDSKDPAYHPTTSQRHLFYSEVCRINLFHESIRSNKYIAIQFQKIQFLNYRRRVYLLKRIWGEEECRKEKQDFLWQECWLQNRGHLD